jgi:D-lyxose ketol-isomerase
MKRSTINQHLKNTRDFFEAHNFKLPTWAYWSEEQWQKNPQLARRVKSLQLGWDITDFASDDFNKIGLILFCLRNGNSFDKTNGKTYAEKIMVQAEEQETPLHFHYSKREDIINRGGGVIALELYPSSENAELLNSDIKISVDEEEICLTAGQTFYLEPGQSVSLPPRMYHRFYGVKDKGKVLVGEVSQVNDDNKDNHFYKALGRFPEIEEDEKKLFLLWTDLV